MIGSQAGAGRAGPGRVHPRRGVQDPPVGGRPRGAGRAAVRARHPLVQPRHPGVQPLLACWPTWPRTSTTSAAAGSTAARARRRRPAASPPPSTLLDEADLDADVVARELAGALVCPVVTAHPTEVRRRTISQVQRQITDLIRQRDRTAGGEIDDAAVVGAAVALGAHPLADGAAAAVPAAAAGRDRRGAALLRPVAVRGRPGHQRRAAPGAERALARRRAAAPADAAARLLDRRRPRRQPVRHRRRAAPGHQPAGRDGAGPPPRRARGAARRAVDVRPAGHADPGALPPGRGLPGRLPVPRRRALPAGAERHLRAAGRHRARACSAGCPARRRRRRCPPTTSPDELRADLDVVDASLRSHGAGRARRRPAAAAARGRRGLRLPPVRAGHAAELRRPRGGRSPSCWPGPGCATTTPPSTRRPGWSCWPAS